MAENLFVEKNYVYKKCWNGEFVSKKMCGKLLEIMKNRILCELNELQINFYEKHKLEKTALWEHGKYKFY